MADKKFAPRPLPVYNWIPAGTMEATTRLGPAVFEPIVPSPLEGLRRPPKGIRRPLLREARAARLRAVKMRTRLQQES